VLASKEHIVNSEILEEQEESLIDFLAVKGDDVDEIDEEYEATEEIPSDPEELKRYALELKERVHKRNVALKKKKDAISRIQSEVDELQSLNEQLRTSSQPPNNGADEQKLQEALGAWRESVADDPSRAVDFAMAHVNESNGKIVDILQKMQDQFDKRIAELRGDFDPEKLKYQDKILKLKTNPELEDIPDDHLLRMAKAMEKAPKSPRGSVMGRKATIETDPEKDLEELKKQFRAYYGG
jgi:hypothetical protein